MLPCFKEKAIAQLLDFNKYTKKKNRQTHPSLSIFLFIFTCVVVAFCPVNPLSFLLHFYAIGVWIRSENRWVLFCPVFYKSQCFQASAAFITEAEILMKPARIRRYLVSSFSSPILILPISPAAHSHTSAKQTAPVKSNAPAAVGER